MSGQLHPHVIRLREPWDREMGSGFLRLRRRFGLPTGLQPADEVDLVIGEVKAESRVSLNDVLLGELPPGHTTRFGIREKLLQRNVLQIDVVLQSGQNSDSNPELSIADCVGDVRLEITAG
jgi:hypothetical protein